MQRNRTTREPSASPQRVTRESSPVDWSTFCAWLGAKVLDESRRRADSRRTRTVRR